VVLIIFVTQTSASYPLIAIRENILQEIGYTVSEDMKTIAIVSDVFSSIAIGGLG
jgi:hypothetical protein